MNLFFVCGAPKSGTTWLQRILDAHPEISCSGEGHFIERFTIPAAKVVNAYNQQLSLEADQVYEGKPVYQPIEQAEFDEVARTFILNRLRSRPADPGVRLFGDKTPTYTHYLPQLHRLFPQARIIHIVRDPRDVAVSRMGHSHRIGLKQVFTPGTEQHRATVEAAVRLWTEAVSKVDAFAAEHPQLVHELKYRDLHYEPANSLKRLFGFLGADADPVLLDRISRETSFEALSGGRKAGEEDPNAFLRKGVPGDWKTRLDVETARIIDQACGPLMRRKAFA